MKPRSKYLSHPGCLLLGWCLLCLLWAVPSGCVQQPPKTEIPAVEWPPLTDASTGDGTSDAGDAGDAATSCLPTALHGSIGQETTALQGISIATSAREVVTAGASPLLARWSVEKGSLLGWFRGHTKPVRAVAFSPDEQWLLSGGDGKEVILWERKSGEEKQRFSEHTAKILAVAWASDNEIFASSAEDGTIRLWKRGSKNSTRTLKVALGYFPRLLFSKDARWLVAINDKGIIFVWDRKDWDSAPSILREHTGQPTALAFSSDSKRLVSGGDDGSLYLWETGTWKKLSEFNDHKAAITALVFSKGDSQLTSTDKDTAEIRIWDVNKAKLLFKFDRTPSAGEFRVAAFSADGKWLAGASADVLRFRSLPTGKLLVHRSSDNVLKDGLLLSPDGTRLMAGGNDGEVRLWVTETGREIKRLKGHKTPIQALGWNEDDKNFVSAASALLWWQPMDGSAVRKWDSGPVASLGFTREALFLLTGDIGHVRLWQVSSGAVKRSMKVGDELISHIATHPTKNIVAVAFGKTLQLWDWDQGTKLKEWSEHKAAISGLAFSNNGEWLVSTSRKEDVWLWKLDGEKPEKQWSWTKKGFLQLRFHPDGKHLVGASLTGDVLFWDRTTGKVVKTLPPQLPLIRRIRLSGNGRWLATSSSTTSGKGRVTWWTCR